MRAAAAEDYRFDALLTNIVKSLPFRARRSSGAPAEPLPVASAPTTKGTLAEGSPAEAAAPRVAAAR